jgi:endonuclease/exonuclease/phosphatase family metal-dependent hydrolase
MAGRWKLATCNVRHGVPWGRAHTQVLVPWADNRLLVRTVGLLGADLLALQEVDRHVVRSWWADQAARCAAELGARHEFGPVRTIGPGGRYGNALVVRGEVLDTHDLALRTAGERRGALFARVRLADVTGDSELELTAVSTHLQNPRRGRPDEAVANLEEVVAELRRWPLPWVLMGDFNLGPARVLPVLAGAGMCAPTPGATHPSDVPARQIDWIASRGLDLHGPRVSPLPVADHRAVTTQVTAGR